MYLKVIVNFFLKKKPNLSTEKFGTLVNCTPK